MQAIAHENTLSETAFIVRSNGGFEIRWFTPVTEVELCGHATLATAYVLFHKLEWPGKVVEFETRSSGKLRVFRTGDLLTLDFPARPAHSCDPPEGLSGALGVEPEAVLASEEDLLVVLPGEDQLVTLEPDMAALARLDWRGICVTAPSSKWDFVSRFFAPRVGIPEDPVTGSAHCVLVPYWAARLGKKKLHARQASQRGGELICEDAGERVGIAGHAAVYLEGTIHVPDPEPTGS
jgi:PhzF family phenazine biosynthesis protein